VPADIAFYEDEGVVVLTLAGDMDDEAVLLAFESLAAHPRMNEAFNLLVDVRPLVAGPVSSSGVRSLAAIPPPVALESKRAVLVSSDFGYGMSRMLNSNLPDERLAFTIFREEEDARRHVGLSRE
jgi:hypothetical protein